MCVYVCVCVRVCVCVCFCVCVCVCVCVCGLCVTYLEVNVAAELLSGAHTRNGQVAVQLSNSLKVASIPVYKSQM